MSLLLTQFQHTPVKPNAAGKIQRHAEGTTPGPESNYPNISVQVKYFVDVKTKLVNPATKDKDVHILVNQFGKGNFTDFDAPQESINIEVDKAIIKFDFRYFVTINDSSRLTLALKEYISAEIGPDPVRVAVLVFGWVDTVAGNGDLGCKKIGNFERMRGTH